MQMTVLCVGQKMPAWVNTAVADYVPRLTGQCQLQLKELPPAKRSKQGSAAVYMADEAQKIQQAWQQGNPIKVVLDERGAMVDTKGLSKKMTQWLQSGRDVVFVVGGPDGLSEEVKSQADWTWSLTPLTLPHPMVRVLLVEQLYRAYSLLNNHPYHRE